MRRIVTLTAVAALMLAAQMSSAQSKSEYQNRFRIMLDFAVRTNEYVRQHLGDKSLASYAQSMAERNAAEAEKMTPPAQFKLLHPHFLLVLENIERSFFHAAKGKMDRYRYFQKVVRKELQILETMADREQLEMYMWIRCL